MALAPPEDLPDLQAFLEAGDNLSITPKKAGVLFIGANKAHPAPKALLFVCAWAKESMAEAGLQAVGKTLGEVKAAMEKMGLVVDDEPLSCIKFDTKKASGQGESKAGPSSFRITMLDAFLQTRPAQDGSTICFPSIKPAMRAIFFKPTDALQTPQEVRTCSRGKRVW